MKLIYADFMKFTGNHLILTCQGTYKDLAKHNIAFHEGLECVFYNEDEDVDGNRDDLVVKGVVKYDKKNKRWLGKIDFQEIKNISQLSPSERLEIELE
jgi:hypothetical protein